MIRPLATLEVERFRALIAASFGLEFDESKLGFLAEVLEARLDASGLSADEYLARLTSTKVELRAVAGLVTVGETYFFRNNDQLRAFADLALAWRADPQNLGRKLRILSAPCASGEEVYSLAITLRERGIELGGVEIIGVDLNPAVLERARLARYSTWSLRDTPRELLDRWFKTERREYVLDDSIRSAVRFEERNLAFPGEDLWRSPPFDIIFCRNMLMYFSTERASELVARFAASLVPQGHLFLGHAETLRGLSHDFHLCHTHGTFYYQRKEELSRAEEYRVESWGGPSEVRARTPVVSFDDSWIDVVRKSADRIHALAQRSVEAREEEQKSRSRVDLSGALDLLENERYAESLELLERLPAHAARDQDVVLLRAVLLTHSGKLAAAEEACREILIHDELHAGAHYLLALCGEGRGDREFAVEHDLIAAHLDPAFAMPHLHLGLLARRAGEVETAREELSRALISLQREEPARLLLFGGGFNRDSLMMLCRTELQRVGGER